MRAFLFLLLLPTMLVASLSANGQGPLNRPKTVERPEFAVESGEMMLDRSLDYKSDRLNLDAKYTLNEEWTIFTDRQNVQYYKDSKLSKALGSVGAIGTMLTVHNEDKDGVYVYRDGEELGWVKKAECVLWDRPLVKTGTAVDIKAFIVNRREIELMQDIKKTPEIKDIYQIYGDPEGGERLSVGNIYDIMFAYKYDKENNKYLLSNSYRLTDSGQLLGWVRDGRVRVWDTAVALEPNWDPESIEERKNDEMFVAKVFKDFPDARDHRDGKDVKELLSMDPAAMETKEYEELIDPSGRYLGEVPRFPYFGETQGIIECGAIGKMNVVNIGVVEGTNDLRYSRLRQKLEQMEAGHKNVNVVFLVDGTLNMNAHARNTVPMAVDRIKQVVPAQRRNRLKFGMVVYGDGRCGSPGGDLIINKVPLTSDSEAFRRRAKGTRPYPGDDGDYYAAMRYGLLTALEGIGMQEDENNIIFHIGRAADVSSDWGYVCDDLPIVDGDELYNALFAYRPALISMQVQYKSGVDEFDLFDQDNKDLMIEATQYINDNEFEKLSLIDVSESISAEAIQREGYVQIDNAPSLMRIYPLDRTAETVKLKEEEVANTIEVAFEDCLAEGDRQLDMIRGLYNDDGTMGGVITEFSDVHAPVFSGIPVELMRLLASERVHFFAPASTYIRHPNATYDSYRPVLFLKHSGVLALKRLFDSIENASDEADREDKKDYLKSAVEQYAKTILNIQDMDEVNIDPTDLRRQVTGLKDEIGFGSENDILGRLSNWGEIEELSAAEVDLLFKDLIEKGREFKKEVFPKGGYPFTYHAGIGDSGSEPELEFYWVPMEYLF